jgi:hypothetical protein
MNAHLSATGSAANKMVRTFEYEVKRRAMAAHLTGRKTKQRYRKQNVK